MVGWTKQIPATAGRCMSTNMAHTKGFSDTFEIYEDLESMKIMFPGTAFPLFV